MSHPLRSPLQRRRPLRSPLRPPLRSPRVEPSSQGQAVWLQSQAYYSRCGAWHGHGRIRPPRRQPCACQAVPCSRRMPPAAHGRRHGRQRWHPLHRAHLQDALNGADVSVQGALDANRCNLTAFKLCRLGAKHNIWCVPCRRHQELFAIYLWCVVPSRLSRPRCPRSEPVCFNVVNDGSHTGNELAFQGYCLHPRRG